MKKEYKYLMLIIMTILFILVIGACQSVSKSSASIDRMNLIDDTINDKEANSKEVLSTKVMQIVKKPIRVGKEYFAVPEQYLDKLQSYISNNSTKLSMKDYRKFLEYFKDGTVFLQNRKSNRIEKLSREDQTVLYFIVKSGLESIHLNLTYDPVSGGIMVKDNAGDTIYNTYSIKDDLNLDYGFMLKVVMGIVAGYLFYFIRIQRRKVVLDTNTSVYE
ncbi:hypothetical protein [Anaeromicropila herbilytica]|uniref:Uncharacterized protein n=1 Tax=Anaeromicropila herbilytica TaxID=2785025 RepID=A0A7R7ENL9_9FIRM|nr:hypothetical protein [Anaeromicropila herbilytica]BCN32260.1 hypothetical protein bsdtb5_35550 [Anaeromicropila herbilytica]